MSYNDAVRVAIANHLNRHYTKGAQLPVHPNDITDIQLYWDNGDRPDPTYGGSIVEPMLEVRVTVTRPTYRPGNPGKTVIGTEQVDVSVELVFTALLRAILETGL